MHFLFLFLDGVGLGPGDPKRNPFAVANMPRLVDVLDGRRLLAANAPMESRRASLLALDACLGVDGLPQSATGQAALLTGENVPSAIGCHYGPKPNPAVAEYLLNGNLFELLNKRGLKTGFLNAYPPRYFEAIASRYRLYSAIPLAATGAGLPLHTANDLSQGSALAADFTGQGWRDHLGLTKTPVLEPVEAGRRMVSLACEHDFAFFEYWLSDYAGHRQSMADAVKLLEVFDQVLGGLLEAWQDREGLALITSDHGNLEDLSTRRHTRNPVPALLIGDPELRRSFAASLSQLTDIKRAVINFFNAGPEDED